MVLMILEVACVASYLFVLLTLCIRVADISGKVDYLVEMEAKRQYGDSDQKREDAE